MTTNQIRCSHSHQQRKKEAASVCPICQQTKLDHQTKLIAAYEEALERLACLGKGDCWGNSDGNKIAQDVIIVGERLKKENEGE